MKKTTQTHHPRIDTLDRVVDKISEEIVIPSKNKLSLSLKNSVNNQILNVILDRLEKERKIAIDDNGYILSLSNNNLVDEKYILQLSESVSDKISKEIKVVLLLKNKIIQILGSGTKKYDSILKSSNLPNSILKCFLSVMIQEKILEVKEENQKKEYYLNKHGQIMYSMLISVQKHERK